MKTKIFVAAVCILLFGCAENNILRTDGFYQSKKVDDYYYYLRFYADSTVIAVSSTGKPKDLISWFNKEHDGLSTGKYFVKDDSLFFESKSKAGIVIYEIEINKNELKSYSKSLINGHIDNRSYIFKRISQTQEPKNGAGR